MQKSHGRIHVEIPLVFRPNPQISTASHPSNLLGRERRGASGSLPLTSDESRCNFQDGIDRKKYIYIYYNILYDYIDLILICLCVCGVRIYDICMYIYIYIYIHIYSVVHCSSWKIIVVHCSSTSGPPYFHICFTCPYVSKVFPTSSFGVAIVQKWESIKSGFCWTPRLAYASACDVHIHSLYDPLS